MVYAMGLALFLWKGGNTMSEIYIVKNRTGVAELFSDCGPFCMVGECDECKMPCGKNISQAMSPEDIIRVDFL